MPLYRKLPKFVGRPLGPAHQEKYRKYLFQLIRLPQLNVMRPGEECDWLALKKRGASLGSFKRNCPVKVTLAPLLRLAFTYTCLDLCLHACACGVAYLYGRA